MASAATTDSATRVRESIDRAQQYLLSLQDPDGWWKGPLDTNVTMDAEDLLMREFLGIRDERIVAQTAAMEQLSRKLFSLSSGAPRKTTMASTSMARCTRGRNVFVCFPVFIRRSNKDTPITWMLAVKGAP